MSNSYLTHLTNTPLDQLKPEQREQLLIWKNASYNNAIDATQKTTWLLMFQDKQNAPQLIRALRQRDLLAIAQAVQSSPRFYKLCENAGLFDIEPVLWNLVRPDPQEEEAQAGRL